MSRTTDERMQRQPGQQAPAPGPQDTEDAAHRAGTKLPGAGDALSAGRGGPASEPFTDVLALPSRPGTRARLLVTACDDGQGSAFEGVAVGGDPGWVLGDGDVVLDISWPGGGQRPGGASEAAMRRGPPQGAPAGSGSMGCRTRPLATCGRSPAVRRRTTAAILGGPTACRPGARVSLHAASSCSRPARGS
jgi:hypothetical protein